MMRRKPALRAGMWIAALAVAGIAAVILLRPDRDELTGKDRAPQTADSGGNDEEKQPAGEPGAQAAPSHEDALRRGGSRDDNSTSHVEVVNGRTTLRIDPETQERSGLRVVAMKAIAFAPEIGALGRVVDLQPLLAQRARYAAARSDADVVRATLTAAKAEYDRLSALNKEQGDIAAKRLQQADADFKRNQAELRRSESEMASVRDETRQQWGPVLASWALDGSSPELERLLTHQDSLLLVTLPPGQTLPPETQPVQVARNGDRAAAVPASYVSPAPAADAVMQGETHFFRTAAAGLRTGMRLDVWAEQSKDAKSGVVVPQEAVVWALGQAWAYVKIDDAHFARRPVATDIEAPGGWFVTDSVKPGEAVVVAGAQMLYAEEFRWQIRDQDN